MSKPTFFQLSVWSQINYFLITCLIGVGLFLYGIEFQRNHIFEIGGVPETLLKRTELPKSCQINSIIFESHYLEFCEINKITPWSRLLTYQWIQYGQIYTHCVCVFLYKESYWLYDTRKGTYYLGSMRKMPISMASAEYLIPLIHNDEDAFLINIWWTDSQTLK